ncbi:DUF6046 domain-containing protein [Polaribacter sp. MSW13]|uniref:DUF6046 domain-containing protein n=1 Tax=Polaribacter marinus TaxID=2916838 RepID=A0A9X2AJJ9_9FLAO|nr:DUF6046 domain-containing protein [Polaribacter marinus]MCI2229586.1 DUF6046 domain-containing protein [Polaribacter marinus]
MNYYNISQLFDIAFGIKTLGAYKVDKIGNKPKDINLSYGGIQVVDNLDYATKLSSLGTPMIVPIKFKGKGYQVYNDFGEVVTDTYADFDLPAATLVNFRRAKTISKTKASAAKGTVKELFGFDDWRIDVRGFCLPDASHATAKTAREQKIILNKWDAIVDSIQVVSELFDDFDISHLVIDEIQFHQLKGKPGVIPFSLRCSSDEPSDLFY